MSPVLRGRLGWATLGGALLLASGGAASRPEGWQLGVPPAAVLAVVAGGLAILMTWWPEGGALGLGLGPVLATAVLGLPVPGAKALTGGPLFALAAAVGVLVVPRHERGLAAMRRAFLPVVAVLCLAASARVQEQVGPEGDEPHYLMVADSLLRDHDLSLERDFAEGRYFAFARRPLEPHYRVRGRQGEIYSIHALGLSLLVLPAYALGGYAAASFFMAGLSVLLAVELRRLMRDVLGDGAAAETAAWVVALSPPLLSYSGLVFTEVPAALGVTLCLRHGRDVAGLTSRRALALGAVLAFLPWLNVRYAVLSAGLALFVLAARPSPRRAGLLLLVPAASALALAVYHQVLYGFLDPRRVYGRRPELSLGTLREGLPGLLLDQEFGLLVYAPVFVLALAGAFVVWRKDRRLALAGIALVTFVVGTAGTWHMWRGGFNPPARFLVPIVPVLALGVAAAWTRGLAAPGALLAGFGLWLGAVGVAEPRLVHRDRDGTAPVFRAFSGAEEWTRLLPGYVLEDTPRGRLALVWGLALVAAVPWRGPATARGLAASVVGLLAAAGASSALATARTGGRDAVRVVGRPALRVPGLGTTASAPGEWSTEVLSWGPAYEPHRFPDGAPLGDRLRLPAGRFEIDVAAEILDPGAEPPELVAETAGRLASIAVFERTPMGFRARFALARPEADWTPRLRGGGTFLLKGIRLTVQP